MVDLRLNISSFFSVKKKSSSAGKFVVTDVKKEEVEDEDEASPPKRRRSSSGEASTSAKVRLCRCSKLAKKIKTKNSKVPTNHLVELPE